MYKYIYDDDITTCDTAGQPIRDATSENDQLRLRDGSAHENA